MIQLSLRSNQSMFIVRWKSKSKQCKMSGSFARVNICLLIGGKPLFIPRCICKSRNDWACSYWFANKMSNWLYGHYRTPTSLFGKKLHINNIKI